VLEKCVQPTREFAELTAAAVSEVFTPAVLASILRSLPGASCANKHGAVVRALIGDNAKLSASWTAGRRPFRSHPALRASWRAPDSGCDGLQLATGAAELFRADVASLADAALSGPHHGWHRQAALDTGRVSRRVPAAAGGTQSLPVDNGRDRAMPTAGRTRLGGLVCPTRAADGQAGPTRFQQDPLVCAGLTPGQTRRESGVVQRCAQALEHGRQSGCRVEGEVRIRLGETRKTREATGRWRPSHSQDRGRDNALVNSGKLRRDHRGNAGDLVSHRLSLAAGWWSSTVELPLGRSRDLSRRRRRCCTRDSSDPGSG